MVTQVSACTETPQRYMLNLFVLYALFNCHMTHTTCFLLQQLLIVFNHDDGRKL